MSLVQFVPEQFLPKLFIPNVQSIPMGVPDPLKKWKLPRYYVVEWKLALFCGRVGLTRYYMVELKLPWYYVVDWQLTWYYVAEP